jgi:hypothetical protein
MPAASRHDLIFGHDGNARVAASVTIVGILVALIGGSFMAIGPRLNQDSAVARNAAGGAPQGTVRVVGTAPRDNNVACEQQVWPNIDQRCLVRAKANEPAEAKEANKEAKTAVNVLPPPVVQDNDKLSPMTAAAVDHPSPPRDEATTGSAVQEDTAVLRSSDTINASAPPNVTVAADNDVDELPPPIEQPRKRVRRHSGFPFHLHFGGFRF